jgi:glycerol-3-phosphate dehydrogenase
MFAGAANRVAFAVPTSSTDRSALLRRGARQLFVVPWRGRTLVGTAHYTLRGDGSAGCRVNEHAARFLEEINAAWGGRKVESGDVVLVHHGLIPLASDHDDRSIDLLKHDRIIDHAPDGVPELLTAISTKFTSARRLAERVVDLAAARCGRNAGPSRTTCTQLPGAPADGMEALRARAFERHGADIDGAVLEHLIRSYGTDYEQVLALRGKVDDWDARVAVASPVIRAQLLYGVREEMACFPEDLIDRRTEIRATGLRSEAALAQAARAMRLAGAPAGGSRP